MREDTGTAIFADNAPLVTVMLAQAMVKLVSGVILHILSVLTLPVIRNATPSIAADALKAVLNIVPNVCLITLSQLSRESANYSAKWLAVQSAQATPNAKPARKDLN